MNSSLLQVVAIAVGLAMAAPALAATAPAKVDKVATVNGVTISKAHVDVVVKAQTRQGTPDSGELRASIIDRLIEVEVLAQEAGKKGLGKNPEVRAELEILRWQTLSTAFVLDYLKNHPVSDAAVKAEYDKLRSQNDDKEYKVRHILLETEDEAKDVIAKLKKGQKFEELAKASTDAGTKNNGGELDWSTPNGYVKPFADAMVKLEKGQYTDTPVHSQFGWHVIRVDDIRPAKYPEFDEMKTELKQSLQQQELQKTVTALRAKAKIEMH